MTLSGWTWGNGNAVQATAPAYNGHAGGFSGTLSGAIGLDGAIQTYCVQLNQVFNWNIGYNDVSVVSANTHFGPASGKADRLGRLLSYVQDQNLFGLAAAGTKDNLSTALQLAIWNIVYDTDATLGAGTFKDTSGSATQATTLLTSSANWLSSLDLWVLATPTAQDQLVWRTAQRTTTQDVPEPGSLALAGLALAGLLLSGARRRA